MKATKEFTSNRFQQDVLENDQLVLVDAWAPWCAPCNAVGPVIDELAAEHEGRITVGKLNVDEHPDIASQYQVTSIPTVLVFDKGQLVNRLTGVHSKATYLKLTEADHGASELKTPEQ
jgi:thioredoxin 1